MPTLNVANRSLSGKRGPGNLKSPRSLKSPKQVKVTRDVEYLNRFINCADPGKDAKEGPFLTAGDGDALLEYVIKPVFNMGDLEKFDRDQIKGVGFNSDYLFKKINDAFKLASIPKQELLRPKFNANKYDLRFNNMNVAHDCGPGPDNLFAEYTLVLTPGSIMDPAKRDKSHTPQISALENSHTLSHSILEQLDLNIVKSIGFSKEGGYKIQIQTKIDGYKNTTFSFNDSFEAIGTDFFDGNPTKNAAIKEILSKGVPSKEDKDKMQMYILIKELGDTLQVMWLKDVIDTTPLSRSNTAICSCDSVVWLRSIVNNVSCIYTENRGTLTTLYPAYEDEKSKILTLIFMKEQAIDKLNNTNESVIDTLSTFIRVIGQNGVEINDYDIDDRGHPEGFRDVVTGIITNLQTVLITRNKDILTQMRKLPALDQEALNRIYEFSEKNTMLTPFIINEKKLAIRTRNGYTHLFKDKRIPFYPGLIYTLVKKPKTYDSKQDSNKIFPQSGGGDEEDAAEVLFGFRGSQEEEVANILDMLKNAPRNSKIIRGDYTDEELETIGRKEFKKQYNQVDTIQTDFILDSSYELILIGYAYAIQLDETLAEQIKNFFNVKYFVNKPFEELKPLLTFLTAIYKGIGEEATLFDLYNFEKVLIEAVEQRVLDKKFHGNALVIYQILFESEYFLTLRNIRGEKNPVDDGEDQIQEQLKDSSDSESVGDMVSPEGSAIFSPEGSVGPTFLSPAASVGPTFLSPEASVGPTFLSPAASIQGEGTGYGSAPGTQSTFGQRGQSYGTQPTELSQHPMYELTATEADTSTADATEADTTVADTTVADTTVADTTVADAPAEEHGSNTQTHEQSEGSNSNMKGGKRTRKRNKKQKAKIDL